MKKQYALILSAVPLFAGCLNPYGSTPRLGERVVPAVEYAKAVSEHREKNFSILDYSDGSTVKKDSIRDFGMRGMDGEATIHNAAGAVGAAGIQTAELQGADRVIADRMASAQQEYARGALKQPDGNVPNDQTITKAPGETVSKSIQELQSKDFHGDPRYTRDGFNHHGSINVPSEQYTEGDNKLSSASLPPPPPAGSSAPYYQGQMTGNPSLWPDEGQGSSLFRDMRAFQPMDIVTVTINEKSEGAKKAETDAESKFSILAAIKNFFGEELEYASDNTGLDPENLINATTESKYEGQGETKRSGSLRAKISAVVLEVLPNGLLRLEGTKIMSVDHEEEVMVISGLVRPRDIDASNQVDSGRIANMRIDFYGRGVVAEQTFPGWFSRMMRYAWPF